MGKLVNYFNWMSACEIRNKADSQTNIFHLFYFLFDGGSGRIFFTLLPLPSKTFFLLLNPLQN